MDQVLRKALILTDPDNFLRKVETAGEVVVTPPFPETEPAGAPPDVATH
jgi:hypothetical protein